MVNREQAKQEFREARNDLIDAYKVYLEKLILLLDANIEETENVDSKNAMIDMVNDIIQGQNSALETETSNGPRPYFIKEPTKESTPMSMTDRTRPLVFNLCKSDNPNIMAAYYTYRYHNAEFKALFKGDNASNSNASNSNRNNNSSCILQTTKKSCAMNRGQCATDCSEVVLQTAQKMGAEWFLALAKAAVTVLHRVVAANKAVNEDINIGYMDVKSLFGPVSDDSELEMIKSVFAKMKDAGFKPNYHPNLWAKLAGAPVINADKFESDPHEIFNSIPRLSDLPEDVRRETEVLLRCFDTLSSYSVSA